jgi:hypothetical protein
MSLSDREYFCRRAHEERAAANQATNAAARALHLELAVRYEHAAALNTENVLPFEARGARG